MSYRDFDVLTGQTIYKIVAAIGSDEVRISTKDGKHYEMFHNQSCCESVYLEDICGDLEDLLDTPILLAEESSSNTNPEGVQPEYQDSFTWTFYKLSTIKGSVTLRFYGGSNGYYSESVDFVEVLK